MKSFSRLAANAADADAFDLADGFVDPDATMMSVVTPERSPAPAPVPARGATEARPSPVKSCRSRRRPRRRPRANPPRRRLQTPTARTNARPSGGGVPALLASTLKSKADVLLTASSGSSGRAGPRLGPPERRRRAGLELSRPSPSRWRIPCRI